MSNPSFQEPNATKSEPNVTKSTYIKPHWCADKMALHDGSHVRDTVQNKLVAFDFLRHDQNAH